MKTSSIVYLGVLLSLWLCAGLASAQQRTVCVDIGFRDPRLACPTAGTAGARWPCNPTGYSSSVGMDFELWDMDSGGDADDFIGTWRTVGPGVNCATFNWSDNSDPPDVYVNFFPRVKGEGSGSMATAKQNNGTPASQNWQAYGWYTSRNFARADNCGAGATCTILPGQMLVPSTDPNAEASIVWGALDSAMRTLKFFHGGINGTGAIDLEIDQLSQWPVADQCADACCRWRNKIRVPFENNRAREGERVSHEMGHLIHLREFGHDGWHPGTACPGGGWQPATRENDACATTEGFAIYASNVSWWDPDNSASAPTYSTFPIENATPWDPVCSGNRDRPGMAARGFWDLDDNNNELGGADVGGNHDYVNMASTTVLNNWDLFAAGTANRQDFEGGSNGVNLWDYAWNAWNGGAGWGDWGTYGTLIYHNCMGDQEF